jgi:lysophospholipase
VDAGLTQQNLPIEPLLVPSRKMDAIVVFDNSGDTSFWPNGSSLHTTYERAAALLKEQNVTLRMPEVPSPNGFVNGGLNTRPTFFGCNDTTTPVIVYVPTYPWSYPGNISTLQSKYTSDEALGLLYNGRRSLDLNGTISDWPTCLTCALVDNAVTENQGTRSSTCQGCFDRFCWNGVEDQAPAKDYQPVVGQLPAFIQNYPK